MPIQQSLTLISRTCATWPPFKFSGKESLARVGLDLYDFGARMYSPSNMRWLTMDPLCEKYYSISPYAYCAGDPVNLVDPDGRNPKRKWRNGTIIVSATIYTNNSSSKSAK